MDHFFHPPLWSRDGRLRRVRVGELASLPAMPGQRVIRRLIADHPDFPAHRGRGRSAPWLVDLYPAVCFVLDRWPLDPIERAAAVDDRTVTLTQLAASPWTPSIMTIRMLLADAPDFPVIQRGDLMDPYRLDMTRAVAFILANWTDARRFDRHHRRVNK